MYRYCTSVGQGRLARQRGAALFVSLMILILLTLLALSASQVTGLQQRMAGIYSADHKAFQNAERAMRLKEVQASTRAKLGAPCLDGDVALVETIAPPGEWGADPVAPSVPTQTTPDITLANLSSDDANMGLTSDAEFGSESGLGDASCLYLAITSLDFDVPVNSTSSAIVQSIYSP